MLNVNLIWLRNKEIKKIMRILAVCILHLCIYPLRGTKSYIQTNDDGMVDRKV